MAAEEIKFLSGAKRANIMKAENFPEGWWVGFGKDQSCQFEGTWEDMVSFAHVVIAHDEVLKAGERE